MSDTDAFVQEIPEDSDPFAGSDFGDWEQAPEPAAGATDELPTVDKEGNRIAGGDLPPAEQQARAAEGAAYDAERAADPRPEPSTPAPGPTPEAQAAMDRLREGREAAVPPQDAPVPAQEAASPSDVPEPQSAAPDPLGPGPGMERDTFESDPTPAGEPPASAGPTEEAADPTPPSSPPSPTAEGFGTSSVEPAAAAVETPPPAAEPVETPAPEPPETRDSSGKTTHRKYIVLKVTGPGAFQQLSWYVNGQGKIVSKGTPGSKRQTVLLARASEDALAFGFRVLGSPEEGATLVAVAAAYFRAKPVRSKPPEPTRARLQIG